MNALEFLKAILPESGNKFVVRIHPRPLHPKGDATIHEPVDTVEEAAELALKLDRQYPNDNIYFAMASYKEVIWKTVLNPKGEEFKFAVGRTQDNVHTVKCLWQDWDVGKYDEHGNLKDISYETREDALASMKLYVKEVGLPAPLIVSSGNGFHTYWLFDEEISVAEWNNVSKLQRVIMRHLGVKFDPSRDKDSSSILRVPGCRNKKMGLEPTSVSVVKANQTRLPASEFHGLFESYIIANDLVDQVPTSAPSWATGGNLADLNIEYPDSYADIVVKHCNQLKHFSETGSPVETQWWACLGLLKECKDGYEMSHKWSAIHPEYSEFKTDQKIENWKFGPTTCDKFREINADLCKGCTQRCASKAGSSPIVLGQKGDVEPPKIAEVVAHQTLAEITTASTVTQRPIDLIDEDGIPNLWPDGYTFNKATDSICKKIQDENGVWQTVRIASPLFYPVDSIMAEDGTFTILMHRWNRGRLFEFQIANSDLYKNDQLSKSLFKHQITVWHPAEVRGFMTSYIEKLRRERDEIRTYAQMGWKHDHQAFLIGDTLIGKDSTQKVVLGENFPDQLKNAFGIKGDKQKWIDTVDELYNRQYGEPQQLAICAAFSSILNPMLGFDSEWNGIPIAFTSTNSGYSKTTASKIGLSIWMHQNKNTVVADSTPKAVMGMASVMNNLPFLLDEITDYLRDPSDLRAVLYALSNGGSRGGMTVEGKLRKALPGWNGNFLMTGNKNVMRLLAQAPPDTRVSAVSPEATQMRVFEIDLDLYPRVTTMRKGHPDYEEHFARHSYLARTIVDECYGEIGVEYMRFVMENQSWVKEQLRRMSNTIQGKMIGGDATKERFYYHLLTTIFVGAFIAKKLGYIKFDLQNLLKWCIAHVAKLRTTISETQYHPEDHFSNLMAEVAGNLIVTQNFETLSNRSNKVQDNLNRSFRNPIMGRYVVGDSKEKPRVFITVKAVNDYCAKHGVPFQALRTTFINMGLIRVSPECDNGSVRVNLTKGVHGLPFIGSPRCFEFDATQAACIFEEAEIVALPEKKTAAA